MTHMYRSEYNINTNLFETDYIYVNWLKFLHCRVHFWNISRGIEEMSVFIMKSTF
jgi:hypothetical protein